MKEEILFPVKIAEVKGSVKNAENFLVEKSLSIGFYEENIVVLSGRCHVVLDFGKEVCGSIRLITTQYRGYERIRLRTGESFSEASSTIGKKGATNHHALRDIKVAIPQLSDNEFFNTGFRFLRIDHYGFGKMVVKCAVAMTKTFSAPTQYEYRGEDKLLKEIFFTAKHTADLCGASGLLWDGIKRDRLVWVGDMHPEMLAYATLYGRTDIVENSLTAAKISTPKGKWINGINTYSCWWVITLYDYYRLTKCGDFITANLAYVKELGELFDERLNDTGVFTDGSRSFVDWPTNDHPDKDVGVRALGIWAAKSAVSLLEEAEIDSTSWKNVIKKFASKSLAVTKAKQVAALKFCATGELSESEKKLLIVGGAEGMSTFMSYYILKAVAETADVSTAETMLKDYYGGMLARGATTFWEDFELNWLEASGRIDEPTPRGKRDLHGDYGNYCYRGFRKSLCHGWSAGIIAFYKEYLDKAE